jgi:hypothetical protein
MFMIVVGALFIGVASVFVGLLFALPTYLLWNGIVPELFGLKPIGFLQAWGLLALCSLLFKSSTTSSS